MYRNLILVLLLIWPTIGNAKITTRPQFVMATIAPAIKAPYKFAAQGTLQVDKDYTGPVQLTVSCDVQPIGETDWHIIKNDGTSPTLSTPQINNNIASVTTQSDINAQYLITVDIYANKPILTCGAYIK